MTRRVPCWPPTSNGAVVRQELMRHLVEQHLDLLQGEQTGEKEIAVAVELLDLCLGQLHRVSSYDAGYAGRIQRQRTGARRSSRGFDVLQVPKRQHSGCV